jgi:hypothetical protein
MIIKTSGKKEGIGGIPALETRINPTIITTQNKDDSNPTKVPRREDVEWLKVPALLNIPIAAHPCDKETITIHIMVNLILERIPTNIKVM